MYSHATWNLSWYVWRRLKSSFQEWIERRLNEEEKDEVQDNGQGDPSEGRDGSRRERWTSFCESSSRGESCPSTSLPTERCFVLQFILTICRCLSPDCPSSSYLVMHQGECLNGDFEEPYLEKPGRIIPSRSGNRRQESSEVWIRKLSGANKENHSWNFCAASRCIK